MKKILVTGATGHLGSAVIETLLESMPSNKISIITRNEEKSKEFRDKGFNAVLGSYDNIESIERAMKDVDTVLLISSGDQGDRMKEHKNVVDTARKFGVRGIAYTSRCLRDRNSLANKLMIEHFETEDYIRSSGLGYTFFRNILYMDAIPQFVGGKSAIDRGIMLPVGAGKVSFALRSEMGEAIAKFLLREECKNHVYNFTGDKLYSFQDIAEVLSDLSGKSVKYENVDENIFSTMMEQRNVPEPAIRKILDFITDIRNDQEADIYPDLEMVLGRKPTSLKMGLKSLFDL